MGIGTLRRYHSPVTTESGVTDEVTSDQVDRGPNEQEQAVIDAQEALDKARAAVDDFNEKHDAETTLTDEEASQLGDLSEAAQTAQVELEDAQRELQESIDLAPLPPRSGKGSGVEAWKAYALDHGYTEQDLDGLSRDDIAGLYPEVENDK